MQFFLSAPNIKPSKHPHTGPFGDRIHFCWHGEFLHAVLQFPPSSVSSEQPSCLPLQTRSQSTHSSFLHLNSWSLQAGRKCVWLCELLVNLVQFISSESSVQSLWLSQRHFIDIHSPEPHLNWSTAHEPQSNSSSPILFRKSKEANSVVIFVVVNFHFNQNVNFDSRLCAHLLDNRLFHRNV